VRDGTAWQSIGKILEAIMTPDDQHQAGLDELGKKWD
jgi:hypothetical protein